MRLTGYTEKRGGRIRFSRNNDLRWMVGEKVCIKICCVS